MTSVDQGAKINEVVPVPSVASQARGLDAEDRTNRAATDSCDQLLKPGRSTKPEPDRPKSSSMMNTDTKPVPGRVCQGVLPALALGVLEYLSDGRLTHVNNGATTKVLRRNLGIHLFLPFWLGFLLILPECFEEQIRQHFEDLLLPGFVELWVGSGWRARVN